MVFPTHPNRVFAETVFWLLKIDFSSFSRFSQSKLDFCVCGMAWLSFFDFSPFNEVFKFQHILILLCLKQHGKPKWHHKRVLLQLTNDGNKTMRPQSQTTTYHQKIHTLQRLTQLQRCKTYTTITLNNIFNFVHHETGQHIQNNVYKIGKPSKSPIHPPYSVQHIFTAP